MTLKIKLSQLSIAPEAFATAVETHAAALREYDAHLEGVRADADNEALKPEERRIAFPPPSADPMVERAVAEGYEFEGPTLAEKKAALFDRVKTLEADAVNAVLSPHKARHYHFLEMDARRAVSEGRANPEDREFLEECDRRTKRRDDIARSAARIEHSIDCLTDQTIDGWVLDIGEALNG